ncbi:unnamed protein product [Protopolystoma xenopodis]|uniref:Calcineurin-like phosphoesterase domain-containing protein n=1 Tax=Protopolystoma xenopodis TaxID=117903 RepID=A0A3S5AVH7_9PLAT|nr:unnamed protein product [Protopolystoma xenopodis]
MVCGDVEGKFGSLYARINKVIKTAGDFEALFCVGDFFGSDFASFRDYISECPKIPIPTYIVSFISHDVSNFIDNPNGCELYPNITYLGSKGVYSFMSGLRVIYAATQPIVEESTPKAYDFASPLEVCSLAGIDLLLTTQWPLNVSNKVPNFPANIKPNFASSSMSRLASLMRPRYHFAASEGVFYERPPYRNHRVLQEKATNVTRFIGLAKVKNSENLKYLYALKLVPLEQMKREDVILQPPDTTENPYIMMDFKATEQVKETAY